MFCHRHTTVLVMNVFIDKSMLIRRLLLLWIQSFLLILRIYNVNKSSIKQYIKYIQPFIRDMTSRIDCSELK